MTEENIFADELFLSLNISGFRFFLSEIATTLKKVTPRFNPHPPSNSTKGVQINVSVYIHIYI